MTRKVVPKKEIDDLLNLVVRMFRIQRNVDISLHELSYEFIPPRQFGVYGFEITHPPVQGQDLNITLRVYLAFDKHGKMNELGRFRKEDVEVTDGTSPDPAFISLATLPAHGFPVLAKLNVAPTKLFIDMSTILINSTTDFVNDENEFIDAETHKHFVFTY